MVIIERVDSSRYLLHYDAMRTKVKVRFIPYRPPELKLSELVTHCVKSVRI